MSKDRTVSRGDLERIRSKLSEEIGDMSPARREEYLEAAGQVYDGLARMAKIRTVRA